MAKRLIPGVEYPQVNEDGGLQLSSDIIVQDYMKYFGDRGLFTGGAISDAGSGIATIASCTAWCKVTDSDTAIGKFFSFAGANTSVLTDQTTHFIYLDYNDGVPQLVTATSILTHGFKLDHILLGTAFRNGGTLHYHPVDKINIDRINRVHMWLVEMHGVHRATGMLTTDATSLALDISAGVLHAGLNRQTSNAMTPASWSYWWTDDGGTTWDEDTSQSVLVQSYNNTATGKVSLGTGKYGVHWVYMDNDATHVHIVYGRGNYTPNQAEEASVPALMPNLVLNYCTLIAKIISHEGTTDLVITYPWAMAFTSSLATDHNLLGSLQGGTAGEYYHLTSAEQTELNAWLDDVTLSDGGAVDLGSGGLTTTGTLDISGGTLTLANNQISGDKVEGGTIAAITITQLTLDATQLTVTGAELNLLDLAALTAGELLVATGAATAAWQSTGVKLSAPELSGTVTTAGSLVFPAWEAGGAINFDSENMTNVDIDSGTIDGFTWASIAKGDILYANATPVSTRLAIGTDNYLLSVGTDVPAWLSPANVLGDLSGQAGATFDWNTQALSNCGNITMNGAATVDGVDVSAHAANTTTAHGAVSAATASKHVVRDASARAKFAQSAAAGDAIVADANNRAPDSTLLEGSSKATVQDHTPKAHTIVSHSDTTGTGAELNTLTGGGETALHSHAGAGATLTIGETLVYNASAPTVWTDLDLSGTIGSQKSLVLLIFNHNANSTISSRQNGSGINSWSEGVNVVRVANDDPRLLLVYTDAGGIIEWKSNTASGNTWITLVAYIK